MSKSTPDKSTPGKSTSGNNGYDKHIKHHTKGHSKGDNRLRATITQEAARLMYQESVAQYHCAK
ncbi:MAG: hypothetical protein KTR17_09205, partial [Cellvibrionaceae bacterium]|nr:hypothetical protein [Cellvibrionaceae bacterium]